MMRRRSTKAEIVEREQRQSEVIAELTLLGADDVAAQVTACWHDRLFGHPDQHRYRCRSAACGSCRRPPLAAWWRSYVAWGQGRGATSYAVLRVDDPFIELPIIAKQLRNRRDRLVRESWLFEDLGVGGLTDGQDVHLLVSHPLLARAQVQQRLRSLWPELVLADVPTELLLDLSSPVLALLGSMRRGLQPARFVVLPRQGR